MVLLTNETKTPENLPIGSIVILDDSYYMVSRKPVFVKGSKVIISLFLSSAEWDEDLDRFIATPNTFEHKISNLTKVKVVNYRER